MIKSRRYFYNRFLKHWPDLEEWFAAPLLARLDLGLDGTPVLSAAGPGQWDLRFPGALAGHAQDPVAGVGAEVGHGCAAK